MQAPSMDTNGQLLIFLALAATLSLASHLTLLVAAYSPPDNIALNCGGDDDYAEDGRKWIGDNKSNYFINNSSVSADASQNSGVPRVPYTTARIFHSQFTYTINVSAGPKFIRLHFHAASYPDLNTSNSFFTVTANDRYTLLQNFSASLTSRYLNVAYFPQEFTVNIAPPHQSLNLTFLPNSNSFGFVNGIEVVSMPANLYVQGPESRIPIVGQDQRLTIDNNTALQMVYRLNVAGQALSPSDDTGMFRAWLSDVDYRPGGATGADDYHLTIKIRYTQTLPPYVAPEKLYQTARSMGPNDSVNANHALTWQFPVDMGFSYLARLHFCETSPHITRINQRTFQILLNNQTADKHMDIIDVAGGNGVPIYKDFIVIFPHGTEVKQDLWLALHPDPMADSTYKNALLNGLEIFKLNSTNGSLAGPNPSPTDDPRSNLAGPTTGKRGRPQRSRPAIIIAPVLTGVVALAILVLSYVIRRRRGYRSGSSGGPLWTGSELDPKGYGYLPTDLCRKFSLDEIKAATDGFSDASMIGRGGFGSVYRGHINGGETPAAIKRLNPMSKQGVHEFCTEIHMLSRLRHVNLVSLIGYCVEEGELILVYDYMSRGSLRDHLYGSDNPPLSWRRRLEICLGAARGLYYLHSGAKHAIIHRDVKTSNILLDEKWVAKVSDFGLSRVGPTSVSKTHVSTVVKGSLGYLDPEYYRRQQLTEKSDVYSFGVVLLEVLCARPPVDKRASKDEVCLSEWARSHFRGGTLDQIVDPRVKGGIAPECLRKIGETADACLLDHGSQRPGMADVIWNLEFALKLQETAEEGGAHKELDGDVGIINQSDDDAPFAFSSSDNASAEATTSGDVFSDIKTPKGR